MNLSFEKDSDGIFWLWGEALRLNSSGDDWRGDLSKFIKRANTIIGLENPAIGGLTSLGAVLVEDGESKNHVLLAETANFESTFFPVRLSARGGVPSPRPWTIRALELGEREPRFEKAAARLASAGDDYRELFKVAEMIEYAHGGLPRKRPRNERLLFFERLQVEEEDWEALHRSARPHRHEEEHVDGGPKITAGQARALLQHALKLWLEREIPV